MKRTASPLTLSLLTTLVAVACAPGARVGTEPPPPAEQALTAEEAEAVDGAIEGADDAQQLLDELIARAAARGFTGTDRVCTGGGDCAAALRERAAELRAAIAEAAAAFSAEVQECITVTEEPAGTVTLAFDGCTFKDGALYVEGSLTIAREVIEGESASLAISSPGLQLNEVHFSGSLTRSVLFGGEERAASLDVDAEFAGPEHSASVVGSLDTTRGGGCRTTNGSMAATVDGVALDVTISALSRCIGGCPSGEIVVDKGGMVTSLSLADGQATLTRPGEEPQTVQLVCSLPRRAERRVPHHPGRRAMRALLDHTDHGAAFARLLDDIRDRMNNDGWRDGLGGCNDAGCTAAQLDARAGAARDAFESAALALGAARCVTAERVGDVLTITFDACSFGEGALEVDGALSWQSEVVRENGATLQINFSSPGLTVNQASFAGEIASTITIDDAAAAIDSSFDVDVAGAEHSSSAVGQVSVDVDRLSRCATLDGAADVVIDAATTSIAAAGVEKCAQSCPTAGTATLVQNGESYVLTFDGSAEAALTVNGTPLPPIALPCGA